MCREGKADMALDLFMNARAEGIKPNVTICDSITGTFHQLDSLKIHLNFRAYCCCFILIVYVLVF